MSLAILQEKTMTSPNFITQNKALNLLGKDNVKFIDGSWYLPAQNRDAKREYNTARIPSAVYFDIDVIADSDTDLPHMLPDPDTFAKAAGMLGINNQQTLIVYDGPGLFSAPRVWWTLKTMGAKDVRILVGGFDQWQNSNLPVEEGTPTKPEPNIFKPNFTDTKVASIDAVKHSVSEKNIVIIDARPTARFKGQAPEPRKGLRSGHIPSSKSLPASDLVKDGKLLDKAQLEAIFKALNINKETPVITTCGSGVTAAILSLALTEIGNKNYKLFDGSWAQWGMPDGPEVAIIQDDT